MAVPDKREADHFTPDFDTTPTKKVKVEKQDNTKASPMKWTVEEAKLIKKLREEKLDWKQIAQYFPGVQSSAIRVVYNKRLKGLCDTFTDDEMVALKQLIVENKKKFWADIGASLGKSAVGCEMAAKNAKLQISMY